jgi:D-alanine--poly(phosphoribitol) ligase subunit 2
VPDTGLDPKQAIHAKVVEIAKQLGKDARPLRFDQQIPASGLLDSAGIMELMTWFELAYDLDIDQRDLNVQNFGTIEAMEQYLKRNRPA